MQRSISLITNNACTVHIDTLSSKAYNDFIIIRKDEYDYESTADR